MRFPRLPILMYHSICQYEDDSSGDSTSPERFQAQMQYIKRHNMRGVSMRELVQAVSLGNAKRLVGLTFDDAYEDFLPVALPVLERLGFTATLFVIGNVPTEAHWEHERGAHQPLPRRRLLGVDSVREVAARGMEVGAHSMSHLDLSSLEAKQLEEEVSGSRRVLSDVLGETVEGFCYPYGRVDSAAIQAVRRAGYAYACSIHSRVERTVYDLPRVPIAERDHLPRFAAKLKMYSQYSSAKQILKAPMDSVAKVVRGSSDKQVSGWKEAKRRHTL
jgi:peptidoglycan/xylan/chitin deacetylase (PgdA/CDA1 family)